MIMDEVATDGQGIETYRKRARSARARAKQFDHLSGLILTTIGQALEEWQRQYTEAGGTMELEHDGRMGEVAENEIEGSEVLQGGDGSGDGGGADGEDGSAG